MEALWDGKNHNSQQVRSRPLFDMEVSWPPKYTILLMFIPQLKIRLNRPTYTLWGLEPYIFKIKMKKTKQVLFLYQLLSFYRIFLKIVAVHWLRKGSIGFKVPTLQTFSLKLEEGGDLTGSDRYILQIWIKFYYHILTFNTGMKFLN